MREGHGELCSLLLSRGVSVHHQDKVWKHHPSICESNKIIMGLLWLYLVWADCVDVVCTGETSGIDSYSDWRGGGCQQSKRQSKYAALWLHLTMRSLSDMCVACYAGREHCPHVGLHDVSYFDVWAFDGSGSRRACSGSGTVCANQNACANIGSSVQKCPHYLFFVLPMLVLATF